MKTIKKDYESKQDVNTEICLKKKNTHKKREYGKNKYHDMSEEKKQRLKEYQKDIVRLKSLNPTINKIVF